MWLTRNFFFSLQGMSKLTGVDCVYEEKKRVEPRRTCSKCYFALLHCNCKSVDVDRSSAAAVHAGQVPFGETDVDKRKNSLK